MVREREKRRDNYYKYHSSKKSYIVDKKLSLK